MNVSRLESFKYEQEFESLKRLQMQAEIELKKDLMEMNPQNPIQNEQGLEILRRFQIQQRVEFKRNRMGIQAPSQGKGVQNSIQGFGTLQLIEQENDHEQSSAQMWLRNQIQEFEMAWQPNGQEKVHKQSPVQMPPLGLQNPIQDYERAWQTPPVQISQMGVQNQIQDYGMGAWQENSYKQPCKSVKFPPMGVLRMVPPIELQAEIQSWMHLIPPGMPPPFFDNKFQAWMVAVPTPVSIDVPPRTESDEVLVEGPLAAQMITNVPQMGQNVPQMGPIVPQISPTGSGDSLTSGFASDFNSSTSTLSRPSPGSSPDSNLDLILGSNPDTEEVVAAQKTWVPNPKANEFIPGGNQPEVVPNQEPKDLFPGQKRTNPQEKSQNFGKEDLKGGPTAQQGGWGGFRGSGGGGIYDIEQNGGSMGDGYEQQGYGGGPITSRGMPMGGGSGGYRSTPYGGHGQGRGGEYAGGGRGGGRGGY